MSVASFLRAKRNEMGLSQRQLADQAGLTVSSVKNYESGRNTPPLERLIQLANLLDFDPAELFREAREQFSDGGASEKPKRPPRDEKVQISRAALQELLTAVGAGETFAEITSGEQRRRISPPEDPLDVAREAVESLRRISARRGTGSPRTLAQVDVTEAAFEKLDLDQLDELLEELAEENDFSDSDLFMDIEDEAGESAPEFDAEVALLAYGLAGPELFVADYDELAELYEALEEKGHRPEFSVGWFGPILASSKAEKAAEARPKIMAALIAAAREGHSLDVVSILNS